MKFLQEVTQWNTTYVVPNHVYYLSDDRRKAVGYIPAGTKKLIKFSKPIGFDVKGRKFVKLDRKAESDSVYFPKQEQERPAGKVIEVIGSNGKKYFVSSVAGRYSCSCPGFTFRHTCKHVTNLQ